MTRTHEQVMASLPADRVVTVMGASAGDAWRALVSRLMNTCCISVGSNGTIATSGEKLLMMGTPACFAALERLPAI